MMTFFPAYDPGLFDLAKAQTEEVYSDPTPDDWDDYGEYLSDLVDEPLLY